MPMLNVNGATVAYYGTGWRGQGDPPATEAGPDTVQDCLSELAASAAD